MLVNADVVSEPQLLNPRVLAFGYGLQHVVSPCMFRRRGPRRGNHGSLVAWFWSTVIASSAQPPCDHLVNKQKATGYNDRPAGKELSED